jgi:hypothetical protein
MFGYEFVLCNGAEGWDVYKSSGPDQGSRLDSIEKLLKRELQLFPTQSSKEEILI